MVQGKLRWRQVRRRRVAALSQRWDSDRVEGWLDARSAKVIAALGEYQTIQGIRGAVGEIGVHHGKLLVLLDLIKAKGEISFAVDLFDESRTQCRPVGTGRLFAVGAKSREILHGAGPGRDLQTELDGSAGERNPGSLRSCTRLFSVDGGHTAACTLNDMQISEASTIDHGLVVVDDYFNPSWPDVSAGVAQYIFHRGSTLRPFAISPNKLYLARSHCHERYRSALRERVGRYYLKTSAMYDHQVDIYGYDQATSWRRRLINYVKKTPIGDANSKDLSASFSASDRERGSDDARRRASRRRPHNRMAQWRGASMVDHREADEGACVARPVTIAEQSVYRPGLR